MHVIKFTVIPAILFMLLTSLKPVQNTGGFTGYPVYNGNDLGVAYAPQKTVFKVWAPMASAVKLRLYDAGNGGDATAQIYLDKAANGVWQTVVKKDVKNKYYTFQVMLDGKWLQERPDIYAKAVGVNGTRGMVVDLPATNPVNWESDKKPELKKCYRYYNL